MRTKLLFTAALIFLGTCFVTNAQNDTRLGAMVAYGTEIENVGIGVNAEIPVMEKLNISPGFIYYFPKDEYGVSLNWWEINGNANYYFVENQSLNFYGIAGLNYTHVKFDFDESPFGDSSMETSDGRFGVNLGAGANFEIGSGITPFAEVKYVIIDGSQLVIGAGVKFSI
ncbi:outer membrane beta-barrel protein [Salinimicrobium sp. MT39]|uniref:Outer membrane beta-barrel protein n=1 Tax=Salinimicrobium profundisediminis TaxID=2994553 RepID=A0A9X3D0T9_9FLAO|nr:outer membrane beta-barrel protein [Salinimicrobium profundisediminis]MCX2839169.1 outer membrane beta-barrel protein [Salinimicrobium profundisediminis]